MTFQSGMSLLRKAQTCWLTKQEGKEEGQLREESVKEEPAHASVMLDSSSYL